jgi:hypothetical protein
MNLTTRCATKFAETASSELGLQVSCGVIVRESAGGGGRGGEGLGGCSVFVDGRGGGGGSVWEGGELSWAWG